MKYKAHIISSSSTYICYWHIFLDNDFAGGADGRDSDGQVSSKKVSQSTADDKLGSVEVVLEDSLCQRVLVNNIFQILDSDIK